MEELLADLVDNPPSDLPAPPAAGAPKGGQKASAARGKAIRPPTKAAAKAVPKQAQAFALLWEAATRPARAEPLPELGAEERGALLGAEFGKDSSFVGLSFYARVVDCYDGDTVHMAFVHGGRLVQHRARLAGYDSPEMRPPAKQANRAEEKAAAYAARDALRARLGDGLVFVECVDTGKADPYGRILSIMYTPDGANINAWMIAEGHGRPYDGGTKVAFGAP